MRSKHNQSCPPHRMPAGKLWRGRPRTSEAQPTAATVRIAAGVYFSFREANVCPVRTAVNRRCWMTFPLLACGPAPALPLDHMREVYELVYSPSHYLALDPLVYTPKELAQRLASGDFFVQEIMREGKVLYERECGRLGLEARGPDAGEPLN